MGAASGVRHVHDFDYAKRDLMTPDQVMRLPDNLMILFRPGRSPLLASKIRYYADPEFRGLFDPGSPSLLHRAIFQVMSSGLEPHGRASAVIGSHKHYASMLQNLLEPREAGRLQAALSKFEASDCVWRHFGHAGEFAKA